MKSFSLTGHGYETGFKETGETLRGLDYAEESAKRWFKMGARVKELWMVDRTKDLKEALKRFGRIPTPELEMLLHPQALLVAQLEDPMLGHEDRLFIGKKLAEFGDTRRGVGVKDGLVDIEWIEIQSGKIRLEMVKQVFEVKPFLIAKYPVTNAQFQAFINDGGYEHKKWWKGIIKSTLEPPQWKEASAPREMVSWDEAVAFCRWLSFRTRTSIRLPTEWEWQLAATGGHRTFKYPWGKKWDPKRCNSEESGLHRTTPVGIYPHGATAQGVQDIAGNVWEWCLNKVRNPQSPESLHLDATIPDRGIRGGSWNSKPEHLLSSRRSGNYADTKEESLGFRLVKDLE